MFILSCAADRIVPNQIAYDCSYDQDALKISIKPIQDAYSLNGSIIVQVLVANHGKCIWKLPRFSDAHKFYFWQGKSLDGQVLTQERLMINTGDKIPGQPVLRPLIIVDTFLVAPHDTISFKTKVNFPFSGISEPDLWKGDVRIFVEYNPTFLQHVETDGIYPYPIKGEGVINFKAPK